MIKQIRYKDSIKYFSPQTRKQIEIGLNLTGFAKEDKSEGESTQNLLKSIIYQCLNRDEGWKNYYSEQMNLLQDSNSLAIKVDETTQFEKEAEDLFVSSKPLEASNKIQSLLDSNKSTISTDEKGWYLQTMARYLYASNQVDAMSLQIEAHKLNSSLFLPPSGYEVSAIELKAQDRVKNIKSKLSEFNNFENLLVSVDDILLRLSFGMDSEKFERAVDELGQLLGYRTERPDKCWKSGPDNLWALRENEYLFIECKNKISSNRSFIEKYETGQLNSNLAWYQRHYNNTKTHYTMIILTKQINSNAGFTVPVKIMRERNLHLLKKKFNAFILGFKIIHLNDISEDFINQSLNQYNLTTDNIISDYFEDSYQMK